MKKGNVGGQRVVDYFALVPIAYDARYASLKELKIEDPKKGGLVVVRSKVERIVCETDSSAKQYPDHVCTETGRWIPKDFIKPHGTIHDLLIVSLKPGARQKK